ncbi:starch-binding protein [Ruminococcus sp.]|uniref:starch-binding protein n=1 Tax=Ruminococcus sp. TaxID=41978 RepID=UPI00307D78D3
MKVKKLLSFVLVAAMMLSVFVLPATAVSENEIVVHYYNENNWESPYIYYYNDGNTPVSWPGTAMNNDGDNWYSYTISGYSSAKVIFSNNGADQYPAQNQEGLTVSGEKWYKSGSFYDQNPDLSKVSVHYYNSNQWSSPYIYYYTDSETPITWPGTAMTSDGNGWYSYDIYGFDEVKVIFSDNGANQIPQQNETGYTVTGEKWFINGTLYDAEPDGITVHFYDYNNWGNVNIYYYNGNLEGTSWTGVPMYADGDGWYTYKIYGYDEARVLFNNGRGTQIPDVMVEGFPVSDEMWYRNGTWTTERPDEITVYFYKPDGWSAPNIYYYLNDSDTGPAWPGSAMTEVSDGWYAYTITKYASAKVMFNDGTNQIPAQNQPGLDATGIMWYKNGHWYDENDNLDDDIIDFGDIETLLSDGIIDVIFDDNGAICVINGKFTDRKVNSAESAAEVLNAASSLFGDGFNADAENITVQTINTGSNNQESFYRYTPMIDGIPALGSQIIISTDSSDNVSGLFSSYVDTINNVNYNVDISASDAENIAINQLLSEDYISQYLSSFTTDEISMENVVEAFKNVISVKSDLLIYAVDKYEMPALMYSINVSCCLTSDSNDSGNSMELIFNLTYYIYANGGNLGSIYKITKNNESIGAVSLSAEDLLGNTRYFEAQEVDNEYQLIDTSRNIETYKTTTSGILFWKTYNLPGEIASSFSLPFFPHRVDKAAVSAHANMSEVYDFYKNVLGRNSFNDSSAKIIVSYDYGKNYNNAYWDSQKQQMVFGSAGNFTAALDVAGHEFTHAVIGYIVGDGVNSTLTYWGESGALNESYADILGSLIEGKNDDGLWLLAEDSDSTIRSMAEPSLYGQPEHYDNYEIDGDVHYNSGIFNFAAYKMMTDSRTSSISKETWSKVFYESLYRLTTTATFLDARGAVICAAEQCRFDHEQQQAIKDAFDDVGITEPDSIRIELTWGKTPSDLDSHLVGPFSNGSGRFHIYYANKYCFRLGTDNSSLYAAELDYDDTTSYGPEVTTIHTLTPGSYYFYVHDYSNRNSSASTAMANSGATVKVYKGSSNSPISSFVIDPNSSSTYWNVFKLTINPDGNFNIETINSYGNSAEYE